MKRFYKILIFLLLIVFSIKLKIVLGEIPFLLGVIRIENPTNRDFINYTFYFVINFSDLIIGRDIQDFCKNLIFYSQFQGILKYYIENCDNNSISFYMLINNLSKNSEDKIFVIHAGNLKFSSLSRSGEIFHLYEDFTKLDFNSLKERWIIFNGTYVSISLSKSGLNISITKCNPPVEDVGMIISRRKLNAKNKEIISYIRILNEKTGRVSNGFAELNGTLSSTSLIKNIRWYWDIPSYLGGACYYKGMYRGCAYGLIIDKREYNNLNNENLPPLKFVSKFRILNDSAELLINNHRIISFRSSEIYNLSSFELNLVGFFHWCDGWASIEKIIVRDFYEEEEKIKFEFIPISRYVLFSTSTIKHLSSTLPILLLSSEKSLHHFYNFLNKYNLAIINFEKGFDDIFTSILQSVYSNYENFHTAIFIAAKFNKKPELIYDNRNINLDTNFSIFSLHDFYKFILSNRESRYKCIIISHHLFLITSSMASRYAFLFDCFPLFLTTSNPFEIKSAIKQTYETLRSLNLLSTLEPEIIIVGNFSEIPQFPIQISKDLIIYSDFPYADLNDDKFQDFPIRRLCCSLEEINLQIEAKRLANLTKNVLITQSYLDSINENDIIEFLKKGGFIDYSLEIRDKLKYNNYYVERITEKRFTKENLEELIELFKDFIGISEQASFSEVLNLFKNLLTISKLLTKLFFEIETNPIKILDPLNSTNLIKYSKNSSILFIFTLTEKGKYILPTNKTLKEEFNISNLPFIEIIFDSSLNNFENSLPYLKSFTKIGYKNHTNLIFPALAMEIFSKMLDYNYTLSKSLKEARNSKIAYIFGLNPAYLIYIFSENYKEYIEDWLHSIIFIGESFQIINKSKPLYYTRSFYSNPKIKLTFKDICSVISLEFNSTNYTTFVCNYTDIYLNRENLIFYVLQQKIELPQFKSLKSYKINYSIIELNESFPLINISEFYSIVLVNNSNDIQNVYLNIYPARSLNNKTILLKDFEIELFFDNSIEIKDVYSSDGKIFIEIFSDFPRNISIEILRDNISIIKDLKEVYDFSKIVYSLEEGKYLIKIRYFEFEYSKELNVTKPIIRIPSFKKIIYSVSYFLKIFEIFFKREVEFRNSSVYTYSVDTPFYKFKIENSNIYFKGIDFEYIRTISFSEEIEKLKTNFGYLEVGIKNGNYYEIFDGNYQKLREKLFEVRKNLNYFLNTSISQS